jgi:hypothetical protein
VWRLVMKEPSLRANARVCSPQETETPVSVTPSYLASESLHGGADRLPRPQYDERHSAVRLRRRAATAVVTRTNEWFVSLAVVRRATFPLDSDADSTRPRFMPWSLNPVHYYRVKI